MRFSAKIQYWVSKDRAVLFCSSQEAQFLELTFYFKYISFYFILKHVFHIIFHLFICPVVDLFIEVHTFHYPVFSQTILPQK